MFYSFILNKLKLTSSFLATNWFKEITGFDAVAPFIYGVYMNKVKLSFLQTTNFCFQGVSISLETLAPVRLSTVTGFNQVAGDGSSSVIQRRHP